jgi:type IV pilus assembly protein PilY1
MKPIRKFLGKLFIFLSLTLFILPSASYSQTMNDYCVTPPFIVAGVKPNLLMTIDNSASMFDLTYIDKGRYTGTCSGGGSCSNTVSCPEGEVCAGITYTRDPYYCYDQTYNYGNHYKGYFEDWYHYYEYDFVNNYFEEIATFPASCDKYVAGTLCINLDTTVSPPAVTRFVAEGNYLNWLAVSKFDVQKWILTGGKYIDKACSSSTDTSTISCNADSDCPTGDTCNDIADNYLKSESRGCVGRKFIKEAITTQSFQEYSDPNPNPNTSLGITFGVRGPEHPFSDTLVSIGGQTYIDIFKGDYKEALCQDAVDAFIEGHDPASIKKAVEDCLSALAVASYCKLEVTRTCTKDSDCLKSAGLCTGGPKVCTGPTGDPAKWGMSCKKNVDCDWNVGPCVNPTATTEAKQKVVFTQSIQACWALDNGTPISIDDANTVKNQCTDLYDENYRCVGGTNDGMICTGAADCPGGTCEAGPHVILPGNPSLLCGTAYAGVCYVGGAWNGCLPTGECGDDCIIKKHEEFCGDVEVPPVIDPSDDPSTTENYDNLPAIIGDIGIESQLGAPIATLALKLNLASPPSGVIQEFEDLIHFGAMTFNYYGSDTECPANVPCTKICNTSLTVCETNLDCPAGETCVDATNLDGGQVISYIMGNCSTTTATTCSVDSHCPAGETCEYSIGDHNSGLISAVDDIFASTWTPFAEGFYDAIGYFAQRTDLRLNTNVLIGGELHSDFITETEPPVSVYRNPVQYRCQKNNVLLITDGMSTADLNSSVNTVVSTYNDGDGQIDTVASATCPKLAGSRNIDDLAWLAKNRDIKDFASTPPVTDVNSRTITSYVVFNGVGSTDPGECNPDKLLLETGENGCDPGDDCYHKAENPEALAAALRETFLDIAGQAASGTAASVLATGEGSGANLVQAIFYPEITFPSSNEVEWIGTLKNIWYYIDPFLGSSSIREDTTEDNLLTLTGDDIVTFYFDTGTNTTRAHLYRDTDGDGEPDSEDGSRNSPVYFENVRSLWEAGAKLWVRSADDRIIYTTTTGSSRTDFTTANAATLRTLLHADSDEEAENIISYVRGYDYKYCSTAGSTCTLDTDCPAGETCVSPRNRITRLDLNGDGDTTDTVDGISEAVSRVYKLGDIVNSTPRIVSYVPLNNYYKTYLDNTYKEFYETSGYQDRGLVLVGANDGMLHAFRLGKIEMFEEKSKKAAISGTDLGKEEWAFIPVNALPYLQYIRESSYCHLYYTDLTPYVLDASICAPGACSGDYWDQNKDVNSWRTIVIGGLRLGGACKDPTDTNAPIGVADSCTKDINGDGSITNEDCVLTPTSGSGYSSYFALDITDPANPQVLWEFSNANLGYSTTGPAIVRISAKEADGITPAHDKNGRWFVVIGSGPTGPIETETRQFYGHSDQNMRVFVLDLKDGSLLKTIDSGIQNAFAGSMVNAQSDFDQDNLTANGFYQDDAVYFGFTKAENNPPVATTKWNSGGVMRLFTKNSLDPNDGTNPWTLSKVIENIGPVTSAVTRLQNFKTDESWLFWGTGRYYFKIADNIDDSDAGRSLYGLKEPCFDTTGLDFDCTDTVLRSSLGDATSGASTDTDGWYINLDSCTADSGNPVACASTSTSGYKTERNVTDPLATPIGAVFFTTTKPAADVCTFGGASHLWVVDFDTGGAVSSSILRGKALLQVSTGRIAEIELETALTEKGGRRTPMFKGVPPTGAPPGILIPPNPVDKIFHIREK